jgi:hypothetical protein
VHVKRITNVRGNSKGGEANPREKKEICKCGSGKSVKRALL